MSERSRRFERLARPAPRQGELTAGLDAAPERSVRPVPAARCPGCGWLRALDRACDLCGEAAAP